MSTDTPTPEKAPTENPGEILINAMVANIGAVNENPELEDAHDDAKMERLGEYLRERGSVQPLEPLIEDDSE